MGVVTSTIADVTSNTITSETIENISLSAANTEVSHTLPSGTKAYKIHNRDDGLVKLAFTAATSGTTFWSIFPGLSFETTNIDSSASITLYMQSPKASQTVEVWSSQ